MEVKLFPSHERWVREGGSFGSAVRELKSTLILSREEGRGGRVVNLLN